MAHNPQETHCTRCGVQLVHTSAQGEEWSYCPNPHCEEEDLEEPEDEINKDQEDD